MTTDNPRSGYAHVHLNGSLYEIEEQRSPLIIVWRGSRGAVPFPAGLLPKVSGVTA